MPNLHQICFSRINCTHSVDFFRYLVAPQSANMRLLFLVLCITFSLRAAAQTLRISPLFSDHVVLQQGHDLPVWGKAKPGSLVSVQLAGTKQTVVADRSGKWMVKFPSMNYGGPYTLRIVSEIDSIQVNDVMIGEVWLASGQSNMEWRMEAGIGPNTSSEIRSATDPMIRYFQVPRVTSIVPLDTLPGGNWQPVDTLTVRQLSAVAYFFSKELRKDKNVAIGILSASWGATSAQAWMSGDMLAGHPEFRQVMKQLDKDPVKWNTYVQQSINNDRTRDSLAESATDGLRAGVQLFGFADSSWTSLTYPIDMQKAGLPGTWGLSWYRTSFQLDKPVSGPTRLRLFLRGKTIRIYLNGEEIARKNNPDGEQVLNITSGLLKKGRNVLAIRLYQNWGTGLIGVKDKLAVLTKEDGMVLADLGGSWRMNGTIEKPLPGWQNYYNQHTVQFNARIAPLIPFAIRGVLWYQGENNAGRAFQYRTIFPMLIHDWRIRWQQGYFPFLFVQLANYRERKPLPADDDWAELREAQAMTRLLPNTGMASAIDIGEALDIHPKNKEDVGKRLYLAARRIAYGDTMLVHEGPVFESVRMEGSEVRLRFSSIGSGLITRNNEALKGFALCGTDKIFHWAEGRIEGNEVVLKSSAVADPVAVRYNWASNPDGNLYNREGLPALSFRTDRFKGITE